MKSYKEYKNPKDHHGGIIPKDLKKAKKVDLITLPPDIKGTNCGNCKFMDNDFCKHKEIQMPVNDRMCCAYWDNTKVKRPWSD